MAETAKTPLAKPSATTAGASGAPAPCWPSAATTASAAAEARQPPTVQARSEPSRKPLTAIPTVTMPAKTPPF